MTNTRIGDIEIIERRYPVMINKFSLREDNSGGLGKYNGGEGVTREVLFLRPLICSILSERRVYSPKGMFGGKNGKKGKNLLIKKDSTIINVGGKNTFNVNKGDIFRITTPGGNIDYFSYNYSSYNYY